MRTKFVSSLAILILLLNAITVNAENIAGSGDHVAGVECDGFASSTEGYYLVVYYGVSTNKGLHATLYWAYNSSKVKDVDISDSANWVVTASTKIDNVQSSENRYIIVWKDGTEPAPVHFKILDYFGDNVTSNVKLFKSGGGLDVAYGGGYFVIIAGTSYAVISPQDGSIIEKDPFPFPFNVNSTKRLSLTFDKSSGYFGMIFGYADENRDNHIGFVSFTLNDDGKLNTNSIKGIPYIVQNKDIDGSAIAPGENGFVVAYLTFDGSSWITGRVNNPANPTYIEARNYPSGNIAAMGVADMDLLDNSTDKYVIFGYEARDSDSSNYFQVRIKKLDLNGDPLDGSTSPDRSIGGNGVHVRYPAICTKPARSPATFVVAWYTNHSIRTSEYFEDFTEVSETNQVPFFSNLAIATATLLGILWIFRRR